MSKLLVIVSITGQQGGSVAQTVLQDPKLSKEYTIRGTTRDTSSPRAQELAKNGVELVQANVDDAASLQNAFKGAHVIYANTVTIYDGHAYEHEVAHGRALVDAAVAVGVPYYIYSTPTQRGQNLEWQAQEHGSLRRQGGGGAIRPYSTHRECVRHAGIVHVELPRYNGTTSIGRWNLCPCELRQPPRRRSP